MPLEIAPMLFLSTAHLKKETAELMDRIDAGSCHPAEHPLNHVCFDAVEYGYLIWANPDEESIQHYPEEIAAAVRLAKANGCRYIKYDCDVEAIKELMTYDW